MRGIRLLVIVCMISISSVSFAQMGMGGGMGGGMRGGRQGMGQSMPQSQPQQRSLDINFIGSVGYFEIDSVEALEKIKVKDASKVDAVVAVIDHFNSVCEDMVDTYRSDLDNLEFAKDNIEMVEDDMTAIRGVMTTVNASAMVIRPIMIERHKELNDSMVELLAPKELKGWVKFYKSICRDNSFNPDAKVRSMPQGQGDQEGQKGEGRPQR